MLLGLTALLAALLLVGQALALKSYRNRRTAGEDRPFALHAAYSFLIAAGFIAYAFVAGHKSLSVTTLSIGALFGLLFSLTMHVYARAIATGPLAYSNFYFSASMIVPVVASVVVWREPYNAMGATAVLLFLVAFFCIAAYGNGANAKPRRSWYIYCLLAFALNGSLSVISKWHQISLNGSEVIEYMGVSFTSAFLCSAFAMFAGEKSLRKKGRGGSIRASVWSVKGYAVILAATTGFANVLIVYLSGKLPGAFLFPFINGSMIILLSLASFLFWKERMSRGGTTGLAIGLAAIVLVSLS